MNFISKRIKKIQQDGFTIIETLVAITILMVVIAGPMTIAQKGLMASIYARDQVIASYLAQDVVEYLKNDRDKSAGTFNNWLTAARTGRATTCTLSSPCAIDTFREGHIYPVTNGEYFDLYTSDLDPYIPNPDSGATPSPSVQSTLYKSIFTRKFYFDQTNVSNPGREATLVVIVSWANGTIENEVKLVNQMFDVKL
jgi:type II secretory pathway pseudopilin PulG